MWRAVQQTTRRAAARLSHDSRARGARLSHSRVICTTAARRRQRSVFVQHINPWPGLAACLGPGEALAVRIREYSSTYTIVSALICAVSAAALVEAPSSKPEDSDAAAARGEKIGNKPERSLLVASGVPRSSLADLYAGACASALYAGICSLGLSCVACAWHAMTPPCGVASFARRNSVMLCVIPGLTAVSATAIGAAMYIHIDATRGRPLSHIGLAGTGLATAMVLGGTVRGMRGAHRAIAVALKAADKTKMK